STDHAPRWCSAAPRGAAYGPVAAPSGRPHHSGGTTALSSRRRRSYHRGTVAVHTAHLPEVAGAAAVAQLLEDLARARDEWGGGGESGPAAGAAPASCLVHVAHLPARPARTAPLERPLPPAVAERLPAALWSHQAEAIDLARRGRSVVVATGTAS